MAIRPEDLPSDPAALAEMVLAFDGENEDLRAQGGGGGRVLGGEGGAGGGACLGGGGKKEMEGGKAGGEATPRRWRGGRWGNRLGIVVTRALEGHKTTNSLGNHRHWGRLMRRGSGSDADEAGVGRPRRSR